MDKKDGSGGIQKYLTGFRMKVQDNGKLDARQGARRKQETPNDVPRRM